MKFGIHHNDLDGIASKIVMFFDCYVLKENLIMVDYPEENIDKAVRECLRIIRLTKKPGELYIADICPSEQVCEEIDVAIADGTLSKVILGDHHKTRKHLVGKYDWFYFDENMCGAEVFAKAIGTLDKYGTFLKIVRTYDLWLKDTEHWKEAQRLNRIHEAVGSDLFFQKFVDDVYIESTFSTNCFSSLFNFSGSELVESSFAKVKNYVDEAIKRCQISIDKNGNKFVWVIGRHHMVNEISSVVFEKFDDVDYFLCIDFSFGISLRSVKFDVGDIAKKRGGGGHKNASGYPLPDGWEKMTIREIIKCK